MYMIYKMKTEELDSRFLRALKVMFKDKEIEIAEETIEDARQKYRKNLGAYGV